MSLFAAHRTFSICSSVCLFSLFVSTAGAQVSGEGEAPAEEAVPKPEASPPVKLEESSKVTGEQEVEVPSAGASSKADSEAALAESDSSVLKKAPTSGAAVVQTEAPEPKTSAAPGAASQQTLNSKPTPASEAKAASEPATSTPRLQNKPVPPPPPIDYSRLPITYHQQRFDLSAGLRVHWVPDSSYEMLADSSTLPLFNLRGAGTVWTQEKMSLALTGEWDFGKSGGSARNVPTSMTLNRFQLGAEGRYHFLHRLAGYGRFSTGLALMSSRLGEAGEFTEMTMSQALFTGALTAGAAFRFVGSRDGRERAVRAHLFFEAGYSYVSRAKLNYEMNESGPLRPESVDLGNLSLSGAEISAGLILSF